MTKKEHMMIKSLKHLILALFVFLGFSQAPTAAETIIMACDVKVTFAQKGGQEYKKKALIMKLEVGASSSKAYNRIRGEWKEFCPEHPKYVRGIKKVIYLDKAARCVRDAYIFTNAEGTFEYMLHTDVVYDFAFGRADGHANLSSKDEEDGNFYRRKTTEWVNCEIQK